MEDPPVHRHAEERAVIKLLRRYDKRTFKAKPPHDTYMMGHDSPHADYFGGSTTGSKRHFTSL